MSVKVKIDLNAILRRRAGSLERYDNTFIIINLHDSIRSEVKRGVIVRMVSRRQRDANLKRIRRAETLAPLDRSRRPFRNLDRDIVHLRVCRFRERVCSVGILNYDRRNISHRNGKLVLLAAERAGIVLEHITILHLQCHRLLHILFIKRDGRTRNAVRVDGSNHILDIALIRRAVRPYPLHPCRAVSEVDNAGICNFHIELNRRSRGDFTHVRCAVCNFNAVCILAAPNALGRKARRHVRYGERPCAARRICGDDVAGSIIPILTVLKNDSEVHLAPFDIAVEKLDAGVVGILRIRARCRNLKAVRRGGGGNEVGARLIERNDKRIHLSRRGGRKNGAQINSLAFCVGRVAIDAGARIGRREGARHNRKRRLGFNSNFNRLARVVHLIPNLHRTPQRIAFGRNHDREGNLLVFREGNAIRVADLGAAEVDYDSIAVRIVGRKIAPVIGNHNIDVDLVVLEARRRHGSRNNRLLVGDFESYAAVGAFFELVVRIRISRLVDKIRDCNARCFKLLACAESIHIKVSLPLTLGHCNFRKRRSAFRVGTIGIGNENILFGDGIYRRSADIHQKLHLDVRGVKGLGERHFHARSRGVCARSFKRNCPIAFSVGKRYKRIGRANYPNAARHGRARHNLACSIYGRLLRCAKDDIRNRALRC